VTVGVFTGCCPVRLSDRGQPTSSAPCARATAFPAVLTVSRTGDSRCAAAPRDVYFPVFPSNERFFLYEKKARESTATRPVFPGALLPGQRLVTLRHTHTSTGRSWCGPTTYRRAQTASFPFRTLPLGAYRFFLVAVVAYGRS
jgi:hypothetical protein